MVLVQSSASLAAGAEWRLSKISVYEAKWLSTAIRATPCLTLVLHRLGTPLGLFGYCEAFGCSTRNFSPVASPQYPGFFFPLAFLFFTALVEIL